MDITGAADRLRKTLRLPQGRPLRVAGRRTLPELPALMPLEPADEEPDSSRAVAQQIVALAANPQTTSVAYQSVAVAAYQVLARAAALEQRVSEAAISLAQQAKVAAMVASLDEAMQAIRTTLTERGLQMLRVCPCRTDADAATDGSWWFSLVEAVEMLEDGAEVITSVAANQPRGCAVRLLGGITVRLLHRHHVELLREAERWMGEGA